MDEERTGYARLKAIFCGARELEDEARRSFLDEACAGDPDLREQVERLLAADAAQDDVFHLEGRPQDEASATLASAPSTRFELPAEIGGYRITGVLGEGGMGIVFRAEQQRPRREVALKVLRSGLVDPETLQRFEREAEVLARLRHPGIAQVYEAGTAEIGGTLQPFFALELVEGAPLSEYARQAGLSIEERIALWIQICDAVEHAHQKAVVHRDLKPANILVDAAGQVKVLDFGIARVSDAEARETSLRTVSGMVMGTLAYMSPEQAAGGHEDVDTRSDVYALGVLGYELLSGSLPHDLDGRSFHRAVRTILEREPRRLGVVAPRCRGDLETIVGKALEKDRARRYSSAAALADDLRRFLADEPIRARPPGKIYLARKFTRRNRALVLGLATTFAALLVGLIVSLVQYGKAEEARAAAEREGQAARRQADKASSINAFVLQDMLAAPDPWQEAGDIRVSEVLDRAAERIEERFSGEPGLEAEVRATIGGSYMARGLFERAEPQLAEALRLRRGLHAGDHDELVQSLLAHGALQWRRDEPERAEELCREGVAMARRLHGEAHEAVAQGLLGLGRALVAQGDYAAAREVLVECLELREALHGGDHMDVLEAIGDLGALEFYAQDMEGAMQYQERALAMAQRLRGDSSPYVAVIMNDLGQTVRALFSDERRQEAVDLSRRAVEVLEASLGPRHAVTLRTRRNLGLALGEVGELQEAEALLREVSERTTEVLGADHIDAIQSSNTLAHFLLSHGDPREVLGIYGDLVPRATGALGPDHPDTLILLFNLAWVLQKTGDLEGAAATLRDCVAGLDEAYGTDKQRALLARKDLTALLILMGETEEAVEHLRELVARRADLETRACRDVYVEVAKAANELGDIALRAGDADLARELLEAGHRACTHLFDPTDWRTADTRSKLGTALAMAGLDAEAEEHLVAAFEALRDGEAPHPATLASVRARLVEFYEQRGAAERAQTYRE